VVDVIIHIHLFKSRTSKVLSLAYVLTSFKTNVFFPFKIRVLSWGSWNGLELGVLGGYG